MIEKYNCTLHILMNKVIYLFTFSFLISPNYDKSMKKNPLLTIQTAEQASPQVYLFTMLKMLALVFIHGII